MVGFLGSKSAMSFHKKQISIESKIERTVEDGDHNDLGWNNKLEPVVSVTIRRGSDAQREWYPKPTESTSDPLNWPTWKREFAYTSFLLLTSTASTLKLVLAPLNAALSNEFDVSYFGAACLTGVPIVLGAVATFGSSVLAQVIGRRSILVAGALILFCGATWNLKVGSNYSQFMAARVFQGIGWGMIDAVIDNAIADLFYYHSRTLRMSIFKTVTTFHIWLAPVFSGYFYQRRNWRTMFFFVGIGQTISVLLLIFLTPETQVDRSDKTANEVERPSEVSSGPGRTSTVISTSAVSVKSPFNRYLTSLRFPTPARPHNLLLPVKAMISPSTILSFLLQAPLMASAYGLSSSLALIFSIAPTFLLPKRIGFLFVLPACFALACHMVQTTYDFWNSRRTSANRSRTLSVAVVVQLLLLGAGGIAGLGLYTCNKLGPKMIMSSEVVTIVDGEMMNEERLWIVGALFGAAVSGAVGTQLFCRKKQTPQAPLEHVDTDLKAAKLAEAHHISELIGTASQAYTNLLSGIFALAFPIWSSEGHSVPSRSSSSVAVPLESSATGPWKRHGGDATVNASEQQPQQMQMEMLMGIQMTVVAMAIVVLVVSGLASVGVVFGAESLRKKDRKVLRTDAERLRDRQSKDTHSMELQVR